MALPVPANTTCDIYHVGNAPPAAPDVAGVPGFLDADYQRRLELGEGNNSPTRFTHVLLIERTTDIRDGFADFGGALFPDVVYVPDQSGTPFKVTFVERRGRGTTLDHKRVYLDRALPTWPTNNL